MCRLFGMLSARVATAQKYLLDDPCSLYVQSNVNPERLQGDGWGVGFYVGRASRLVRSERPVYEEYGRFTSAVGQAKSNVILAHIRRASNPRKLRRDEIISIENSQPFRYRNYLFAHNGTITIPDEVAETLGEWKQNIEGFNDSEVYFWHVMKSMAGGLSFREALEKFETDLADMWQRNRDRYPDTDRPYVGLNALLSDGENLHAYCKYHERDELKGSLCMGDQPAFQMSYLISPTRLVVSSETTNREDNWEPLKSGQLLTGQTKNGKVTLDLEEIE